MEDLQNVEDKIYYKVCRSEDGRLYSATYLFSVVEYKVNEWVSSKDDNGPLAVFDSYKAACIFHKEMIFFSPSHKDRLNIYTCKIILSKGLLLFYYLDANKLRNFHSTPLKCLPDGTVLADKVMLLVEKLKYLDMSKREYIFQQIYKEVGGINENSG